MKYGKMICAGAALVCMGLTLGACGKDKKESSDTIEMKEVTSVGDKTLTTDVDVVENPDGTLEIDNTLPTEVVTAPAPGEEAQKAVNSEYTTTASGLKYKVIKKGSGAHPTATSTVSVKYTGKLQDGTVFDSTDKQGGQPISFPLNRVIPGWTEGLQLMQPGAVYEFVIPSNLAYGSQGIPGAIPPNATLIFDVELVGIQ